MNDLAAGGCLCGGFNYQFPRAAVISAMHCHCKDCQKTTGSGKATIILVPKSSLTYQGELKTFTVQGTEGAHVTRGFCPTCGSQLISFVEEMPTLYLVKAGTLDDSRWLTVAASCWSSSAEPWSPADDNLPVFDKNPVMA